MLVCNPRFRAFSVSRPKKRSTRFSHNEYVGVKRMAHQPAVYRRRLVGGEVVEDEVNSKAWLDGCVDLLEKRDEILGTVALLEARNHLARRYVERREEIKRPVPHVVGRLALRLTEVHRQDRLRSLQGLDLRLLVEREHDGVVRRVHVKADNVANLRDKLRVVRDLKALGHLRERGCR